MRERLVYSLAPASIPVTIGDKEYVLVEPSEDAVRQWRNASASAAKYTPDGKVVALGDIDGPRSVLVGLCLCESTGNGQPIVDKAGNAVSVGRPFVQRLPGKYVREMYDLVRDMGELNDDAPTQKALAAALSRDDSPVPLDTFRAWVQTLEGDVYRPLVLLMKEDESRAALKNGHSSTPLTSGSPTN